MIAVSHSLGRQSYNLIPDYLSPIHICKAIPSKDGNLSCEQECISVGCVPSAAVVISWGWGCLPRGCLSGRGVCPGGVCLGGCLLRGCLLRECGCTPPVDGNLDTRL